MGDLFSRPAAAIVETVQDERQLVEAGKEAVRLADKAFWELGQLAHAWNGAGRTDESFAEKIGSTQPRVNECRRVYESFAELYRTSDKLKWSHFQVALGWPDAVECLNWAAETEGSIRGMKAWRRMQHGEDLTVDAEPDEPEHVADVDPYEKPPSVVVATPREPADDYRATEPPAEKPRTELPKPASVARKPDEPHLTLTEIRRLLVAAEDTAGDVRELRKLAGWHRKRADELDPLPKSTARPASIEEVAAFVAAENLQVEPRRWWDHYESNGWKVGKNPMRDWRAAVRNAHRQGWARAVNGGQTGSLTGSLDRFLERRGGAK